MRASSVKIAYFGEEGSFSHLATERRFRGQPACSCPTVEDAFARLRSGGVHHIIVPIENATSGMILDTVDHLIALAHHPLRGVAIRECLVLPIRLVLLAARKRAPIRKIYSHFAPFTHCRSWLKKHYPKVEQIVVASTSEAARRAREESGAAALAGFHTAQLYGLEVVRARVAHEIANQTKFFVIGKPLRSQAHPTHSTVIFELPHRPGSLVSFLDALAQQRLNLTRIESRPIPGRFSEYRFVIEVASSPEDLRCRRAMDLARSRSSFFAVMGNYPTVHVT